MIYMNFQITGADYLGYRREAVTIYRSMGHFYQSTHTIVRHGAQLFLASEQTVG